jgi:hypothetical protein
MDTELDLAEHELEHVTFGRSRMLRRMGTGLFGVVTGVLLKAAPAEATHTGVPYPCYGYDKCHHCYYEHCTQYCTGVSYAGCHTGVQCWTTCAPNHYRYRCCDWRERFPGGTSHYCICSGRLGLC